MALDGDLTSALRSTVSGACVYAVLTVTISDDDVVLIVVEAEESHYTPVDDLLAIRFGAVDPLTGKRANEIKKRKRNYIDTPVIVKGKRTVKSPFQDYVEAPISRRSVGEDGDFGEAEAKDEDSVSEEDGVEPYTGKPFLELVIEAIKVC